MINELTAEIQWMNFVDWEIRVSLVSVEIFRFLEDSDEESERIAEFDRFILRMKNEWK